MRIDPPGRSTDHWRITWAISARVKPYSRKVSSDTSIAISYGREPHSSTELTSVNARISSRTSSTSDFIVASSRSPDSWTFSAPFSNSCLLIIGRSASRGNVLMPSTASFTSSVTSPISKPFLTSIMTWPVFSNAIPCISRMPSMFSTASSILTTMPSSTSSGPAPGYGTATVMMSKSKDGKLSFFRLKTA